MPGRPDVRRTGRQGCPGADELALFWSQIEGSDACLSAEELAVARPFADRLIQGVVSQRADLDEHLAACAQNWTLSRMSVVDRNILRLAAYELLFCNDIPAIATIDEAIELAKQFGDQGSPRFVNGVLDRLFHGIADGNSSCG